MPRGHGGSRKGAGAKTNAQKNGPPNARNNLHSFVGLPPVVDAASAAANAAATIEQQRAVHAPTVPAAPQAPETEWQREVNHQKAMDRNAGNDANTTAPTTEKSKGKTGQNRRSGLLKECLKAITGKYHQRAIKMVKQGNLWDRPKTVMQNQEGIDMRRSWKEFFKLPVFNWFPLVMLPNFKFNCGTCGKSDCIKKDGMNKPPRLVYGERQNYILNAPQRLCCTRCEKMAKLQEVNGIPKQERPQFNWLTTDDCFLDQLACEEPDVFEEFPCYLSSKAGLDKSCFENVVDNAVKGIGPVAVAESIERKHAATWQSNEIKWAGHLRRRRSNELFTDEKDIPAEEVEKCPEYKSDEMGGVTPSGAYLIHMFCREVERARKHLDADCIKRLITSLFMSIDASYKVRFAA
jgi:hypothetical protein